MKKISKIFALSIGIVLSVSSLASAHVQEMNTNQVSYETEKKGHNGHKFDYVNNEELLSLLNIDKQTLKKELEAGKSIADIANEKGVTKQKVIDLLVKQSSDRVDAVVKDGKISKDQADQIKAKLPEFIKLRIEVKGGLTKKHAHHKMHHLDEVSSILGMTKDEIITQIKSGKSLSEIAKDKGISEQKLIDALADKEKERIGKWVKHKWKDTKQQDD